MKSSGSSSPNRAKPKKLWLPQESNHQKALALAWIKSTLSQKARLWLQQKIKAWTTVESEKHGERLLDCVLDINTKNISCVWRLFPPCHPVFPMFVDFWHTAVPQKCVQALITDILSYIGSVQAHGIKCCHSLWSNYQLFKTKCTQKVRYYY